MLIRVDKLLINRYNNLFFNVSRETIAVMAGVYVHIPFCFSRCGYCDFFKTTKLDSIPAFLVSLRNEIEERSVLFPFAVDTIYFGGGTPSVIETESFRTILNTIKSNFLVSQKAEITIECNPDDLSKAFLDEIIKIGFNRLSIGVQSFNDDDLKIMGRRHDSNQSFVAIDNALSAGFRNIGVDFIYGLPWSNKALFQRNLDVFKNLNVQHISAYHLTIEKGTSFYRRKERGLLSEVRDTESLEQYNILCNELKESGMVHYEVSNFYKSGFISQHNSNYWKGVPYIGFGPGSHSYTLNKRSWNKANIRLYNSGGFNLLYQEETLNSTDRYNEMIMLGLRTMWGVNIEECRLQFPEYYKKFESCMMKWCHDDSLYIEEQHLKCREERWFLIDGIIEDFIITND